MTDETEEEATVTAAAFSAGKRPLRPGEEVLDWYRSGGDAAAAEEMEGMMRELVPGLNPATPTTSDACATCHTPTGRPYVGRLRPGLSVATGGNGLAAKSSDEIGRLGAVCALDEESWRREKIRDQFAEDLLRPVMIA